MKPFSFRLDSILNYRDYLEKKAQWSVVNAINEYKGWEREIERLSEKRIEIAGKCGKESLKGMDVPAYLMYRNFLRVVNDDLERAYKNLQKTEKEIKEKKVYLKGESIKKKTLEKLKNVQFKNHLIGLTREEQKTLDEMAIARKETSL